MKRYAPQCKNCQHCKQIGKTNGKFSTNNTSRKTYYCEHPYIRDIHDKYGQPIYPFWKYNGERGSVRHKKLNRWFFYAYYPAHMLVLLAIKAMFA